MILRRKRRGTNPVAIRSNTELQGSQTTTYIDDLIRSGKKNIQMIYLVPPKYDHMKNIKDIRKKNKFCSIILWDEFLSNLSKYEISKSNIIFDECFKYFQSIVIISGKLIKFNIEEIMLIENINDLINANSLLFKFRNLFKEANPLIIGQLNNYSKSDYFKSGNNSDSEKDLGKYITFNNQTEAIFFGLNFNVVMDDIKNRDFLFGVSFDNNILHDKKTIIKKLFEEKRAYQDNDYTYIKMKKNCIINDNNIEAFSKEVVDIIKEILL